MPKYLVEAEFVETYYVRQIVEIEAETEKEAINRVQCNDGEPIETLSMSVTDRYQEDFYLGCPKVIDLEQYLKER